MAAGKEGTRAEQGSLENNKEKKRKNKRTNFFDGLVRRKIVFKDEHKN